MRKQLAALAVAGCAIAVLFTAPSARAGETDATFTLTAAGGLSISVPASKELSAGTATNAGTLSAALGATSVTDSRGTMLGAWTAKVIASEFAIGATPTEHQIISASAVDYYSGLATANEGTAVLTPGQASALAKAPIDALTTAFSATGTVGNNSATWNPTVVVNIPSDAVVGTYAGTITHSVV